MSFSTINDIIYLDPQNFTTVSGDNDNVVQYSSALRVTCTADNDALTGLIPPEDRDGAQVWITNVSAANTLVIKDNDSGSTEGFRFRLGGATTLTLESGQGHHFGFTSGYGWFPIRSGTFA